MQIESLKEIYQNNRQNKKETVLKSEQNGYFHNVTRESYPKKLKKHQIKIMKNYQQPDTLNKVAEFHRTFNAPILDTPKIPTSDRCKLRIDLLQEELNELKDAIAENDIVEIADALCDLEYVLMGAVLEFGLADKFNDLFNEVQKSNISKVCENNNIANDTVLDYGNKGVVVYKEEIGDGRFLVKRNYDDKILKSINYSPANLLPIIEREYEV